MANINLKRSEVLRTDAEFKKFVQDLSRFKSNQEKIDIKASRITKAMFNQYQKYPELVKEIKSRKLKDEKRKYVLDARKK